MTANSAKRLVVFLVYPDIVLLDLVGPLQVFSHAPDEKTGAVGYDCVTISLHGEMTPTNTVVSIPTTPASAVLGRDIHTLVIVGGDGANVAMLDENIIDLVQRLGVRSERICSVCSGALVLAAAGFLDGRRATTHWDDCKTLAEMFPLVRVEEDPIYVKDGSVWTSAGITAGIDMALAMVAEDLGRDAALEVAKSMVTQMVRSGGQSQFSPNLGRQLIDNSGRFEHLHAWISENLRGDLGVDILAERANMSSRNFSRVYSRVMGVTPAKAVETMRIEAARVQLEVTRLSVKQIADDCGFRDVENMRRAFLRALNVTPSEYRETFGPD